MKDFIKQLQAKLNELSADTFYKTTSKTTDYITFEIEVYDKSYDRYTGQVIIEVRYVDIMDVLNYQDQVITLLDDWNYATSDSAADLSLVIINDLSNIDEKQYVQELRFEFNLENNL